MGAAPFADPFLNLLHLQRSKRLDVLPSALHLSLFKCKNLQHLCMLSEDNYALSIKHNFTLK